MDIVVTIKRGDLDYVSYNDELMKLLEAPLAEGKGASFTAWQRFRRACKDLTKSVEDLAGSRGPFTVSLRVEGMKKVWPTGPMLYAAGSMDDRQSENEPGDTGEGPQA